MNVFRAIPLPSFQLEVMKRPSSRVMQESNQTDEFAEETPKEVPDGDSVPTSGKGVKKMKRPAAAGGVFFVVCCVVVLI